MAIDFTRLMPVGVQVLSEESIVCKCANVVSTPCHSLNKHEVFEVRRCVELWHGVLALSKRFVEVRPMPRPVTARRAHESTMHRHTTAILTLTSSSRHWVRYLPAT